MCMKEKNNDDFKWLEVCKYEVSSYTDRYNNELYKKLKSNNIECINQLEFYYVDNVDKRFKCTLYVQEADYEKGIKILKKDNI